MAKGLPRSLAKTAGDSNGMPLTNPSTSYTLPAWNENSRICTSRPSLLVGSERFGDVAPHPRAGSPRLLEPLERLVATDGRLRVGVGRGGHPLRKIELAVNASEVVTETLREWLDERSPVNFDAVVQKKLSAVSREPLVRPRGRKLDDEFYRRVSFAYRDAVRRGLNPAKTIAADTKTPMSTVNRWIAEARKPERGYLPQTTSGKVRV